MQVDWFTKMIVLFPLRFFHRNHERGLLNRGSPQHGPDRQQLEQVRVQDLQRLARRPGSVHGHVRLRLSQRRRVQVRLRGPRLRRVLSGQPQQRDRRARCSCRWRRPPAENMYVTSNRIRNHVFYKHIHLLVID